MQKFLATRMRASLVFAERCDRAWVHFPKRRCREVHRRVAQSGSGRAMGAAWIPVFNLLEDQFTVVLANPEEVKNRKGHKTDRNGAKHLADLLRHGHIRSSYIPPKPVRQLRALTRRRVQLIHDAARDCVTGYDPVQHPLPFGG
jgi:transposase